MGTTYQTIGNPIFYDKFDLKYKIYYEIVQRLLRLGRKYFPIYFARGMLNYIYSNYKHKNLTGVEIGVQNGYNSKVMLLTLPIKKLYCIDPYEDYTEKTTVIDRHNKVSKNLFDSAKKYLQEFKDKIEFIKDYSDQASKNFKNESLDFVYIDGNHSYDFVMKDILFYLPKVKKGGILGGHDFGSRHGGVVRAVFDFIEQYDYDLYVGKDCDWWIIKKE